MSIERKRKRKRGRGVRGRSWCVACAKHRHPTRGAAKVVIQAMERSGRAASHPRSDELLGAYHCLCGPGWHVGHTREVKPWLRRRKGA